MKQANSTYKADPLCGYEAQPLEVALRHEAGHAVMSWHLGCYVRWIIYDITETGWPRAHVNHLLPEDVHGRVLVLMGGVLALYLHDVPGAPNLHSFVDWVNRNKSKAVSGGTDWQQIAELTGKPPGSGWQYFMDNAVFPHFDEAANILADKRGEVESLVRFMLARPVGVGPRALRRFEAGLLPSRWAEALDWPRVRFEAWRSRYEDWCSR
jgi:hypothetical protein